MDTSEMTISKINKRLSEIEEKLEKQKAAVARLNQEKRRLIAEKKKREAKKSKKAPPQKAAVKKAAPNKAQKGESVLEAILTQVAQEVLKNK